MEQWRKRVHRTCIGVLVMALILRLGGSVPASVEVPTEAAAFLLYLQTGRTLHPIPQETQTTASPTEAVVFTFPTAPADEPLSFTAQEADSLSVKLGGSYTPDLGALLEAPVDLNFSGDAPRILIIHTHATESYTQEEGWTYTASANYRTLDENYNMIRVGSAMAEILEAAGICVLHDTTLTDYPSYNGSYDRANEIIHHYLEEYPSIQMVIDVHRDAAENPDGSQMGTSATANGRPAAQLMLVMGTDEGGLYHPNWAQNLSWALKLQAQLEREYPGITRSMSLRPERYNQHATPGSILLEVGAAGDTLQEAIVAGEAFAHTLVSLIAGLGLNE